MKAKPISTEEQYRLVLECRASGLSDYQWCTEHGIKPGTFYNWIRRLRKKGQTDIPAASRGKGGHPTKQEVVKLDFSSPSTEPCVIEKECLTIDSQVIQDDCPVSPFVEVVLLGSTIRIPPGTDGVFMERVFRAVKAATC